MSLETKHKWLIICFLSLTCLLGMFSIASLICLTMCLSNTIPYIFVYSEFYFWHFSTRVFNLSGYFLLIMYWIKLNIVFRYIIFKTRGLSFCFNGIVLNIYSLLKKTFKSPIIYISDKKLHLKLSFCLVILATLTIL